MIKNLDPKDVARLLKQDAIVLVDVREPNEYAAQRIAGAKLVPLSSFDPHSLPESGGRAIVFHCGVGGRSAKAVAACQAAGLAIDSHMKGGIQAWMAAGLPVER
jgi:rhodanese-related sulfurtransferase